MSTRIMLCIVMFLLGAMIAFKYGLSSYMQRQWTRDLTKIMWSSIYAFNPKDKDNYRAVKGGVINFISYLDKFENSDDPAVSRQYLAFNKMLSYAILSKMSQEHNENSEAVKYMSLAKEQCKLASWKDCSDEVILYRADEFFGSRVFTNKQSESKDGQK